MLRSAYNKSYLEPDRRSGTHVPITNSGQYPILPAVEPPETRRQLRRHHRPHRTPLCAHMHRGAWRRRTVRALPQWCRREVEDDRLQRYRREMETGRPLRFLGERARAGGRPPGVGGRAPEGGCLGAPKRSGGAASSGNGGRPPYLLGHK